jgi:predicted ferric reductase
VIGVSFEHVLYIHRALANTFLVVLIFHVICWYSVFVDQHVFPHDALSGIFKTAPTYFPLNAHAKPGHCSTLTCLDPEYHKPAADNFTLPLMNFIGFYIVLPVFGVLTCHSVRRRKFELFYFAHLFGAGVLLVGVMFHAASVFVFLFPSLVIMFIDACVRYWQVAQTWQVEQVEQVDIVDGYLTSMCVGRNTSWNFTPGQYVLVSIPSVSQFQFHPFSVGLKHNSGKGFWIHALAVGNASSFTRRLLDKVKVGDGVYVQGPFGTSLPPTQILEVKYTALIFVVGGIGVTPILSAVQELIDGGRKCPMLIIWTCKDDRLFHHFRNWISTCRDNSDYIDLRLFQTSNGQQRPNIQLETQEFLSNYSSNVFAFACGPASLIAAARNATSQDCDFVNEEFEL